VSTAARRVRRVRLAAPSDPLVRRGALLLEDALHTATLPAGEGGRLLLVRSLDVGRIDPAAPPSSLALAVERRMRELARDAVWAGDPAAPRAAAVFFRDAAEAAGLLAVRLIRDGRADAWFWRAAVPGFRADEGMAPGVRLALAAAAASPSGAVAVAGVLRTALEHACADALLACVGPEDARRLLDFAGWTAEAAPSAGPDETAAPEWRPLLARWIGRWGADDPRSVWLAAAVLVDARPSRAADPRLPARAARLAARVLSIEPAPPPAALRAEAPFAVGVSEPPRARETHPSASASTPPRWLDDPPPRIPSSAPADPPPSAESHPSPIVVKVAEGGAQVGDDSRSDVATVDDHPSIATAEFEAERDFAAPADAEPAPAPVIDWEDVRQAIRWMADGAERSTAAGLFFLLAAMERLGMRGFLERAPELLEAELPARVLLRVAERTGVPEDDPAVAALAPARDAGEAGARYSFAAPPEWAGVMAEGAPVTRGAATLDASGRLAVALEDAEIAMIVEAWVSALRRWCRRRARIGLHALVRRRGRIAFTRTHVDATLPLDDADVRVRAAGLDLDPGWVPWLGAVVAFHYTD
jgi:hypothetical protein